MTIRKPSWMTMALWNELLLKYNGVPRCEKTGEAENLSVDHINPRYFGGEDKVENFQFLARRLNAKKGTRPDEYWSQQFYFDQTPNLEALRTAQVDGYNALMSYGDWFGQPYSDIARFLYCFAWVVGAGKTLGILTTACAMNAITTSHYGAGYARRADRILVLTKEQAIRDQIAADLVDDSVRYGIFSEPPTVGIVTSGDQWGQRAHLDGKNVIVACIQQLWGDDDQRPADFYHILHEFPLIFIDEPHFAWKRVLGILNAATTSLCFGFTGTPIDKKGIGLLQRMVLVNVHGYQDANDGDRSMKYLADDNLEPFVRELKITAAEALILGDTKSVNSADPAWYMKNIEPAKSVLREVIREMKKRDTLNINLEEAAKHRLELDHSVEILYSSHGAVVVPNVEFGKILCEVANSLFKANRAEYPAEEGWGAEIVHADGVDLGGLKRLGKPLTPDHPWLLAKRLPGLKANASCARLIFLCGMGREGLNNPLCGPIGVVTAVDSQVEAVQRWIGRQIRAVVQWRDECLIVPPADLDQVCIITHVTFKITDTIKDAIDFTLHMRDKLSSLLMIADLQNSVNPEEIKPILPDGHVSNVTKVQIAGILNGGAGDVMIDGVWPPPDIDLNQPIDPESVVKIFGGDYDFGSDGKVIDVRGLPVDAASAAKFTNVKKWVDLVVNDPKKAGDQLHLNGSKISAIYTVLRETINMDPSEDEVRGFLRSYHPHLKDFSMTAPREWEFAKALFIENAKRSALPRLVARHTLDQIRHSIAKDIKDYIRGHYKPPIGPKGKPDETIFYTLVGTATKDVLGVPSRAMGAKSREKASNNSKWDNPYTHALLVRPDVRDEMKHWVVGEMIDNGLCPSLKVLRR